MESFGRHSEIPPSETFYEHFELSHYIDTFRVSAERVRRLVFIIAVFSVVMSTALWNSTPASWMGARRLEHYRALRQLTPAQLAIETHGRLDHAELENRIREYSRLRTEKVFLPQIPGVGVVFDINDLGNFCGLAYFLLLALLFFSVIREHEHLYLSLFKVRRLHDEKRGGTSGESQANYLYHALAMSQVLCMPPTLAQWKPSRLQRLAVPYIIFTFPIVVELAIFFFDWSTAPGEHPLIMIPEGIFMLLNLACCFMCYRYSLDFNHMWAGAFRHINPSYEYVERRSLLRVFHFRRSSSQAHMERRLRAQAVAALNVDAQPDTLLPLASQAFIADKVISNTEIERMCAELERQAEAVGTIVDCNVNLSKLTLAPEESRERNSWEVQAVFTLRAAPLRFPRQAWLRRGRFRRATVLALPRDVESSGGPGRPAPEAADGPNRARGDAASGIVAPPPASSPREDV